jgi:hypothetical protein
MIDPKLLPQPGFAERDLDIVAIGPELAWSRLSKNHHPDPLGYGWSPSRFSDPGTDPTRRFAIIYFGATLKVCFLEAVLRDKGDGRVATMPIEEGELLTWNRVQVSARRPLRLVDLREDGPVRMGIPTDAVRAADQRLGRIWSRALWEHDAAPDGMIYPSRLNGHDNIALYDRALVKLATQTTAPLMSFRDEMARIIDDLDLSIE